jgi:hypothetical protein
MIKFHEEVLLDEETSDSLVIDLKRYTSKESLSNVHGGRWIMPNTSDEFKNLLSNSEPWRKVYRKLSSPEFLSACMESLEMPLVGIELNPYFSKRVIPQKFRRLDALKSKRIRETSLIGIFLYLIYSLWNNFCFYLFRFTRRFSKKIHLDILFDVSQAENGYVREIHRDSDSRYVVFLLYLNDLSTNGNGGELNLFEYTGSHNNNPGPQPAEENCVLIKKIFPSKGKLVIFKNNKDAFHSVSEMSGYDRERIFCYGSFTVLNGLNPNFNKSSQKFKTPWRLYY